MVMIIRVAAIGCLWEIPDIDWVDMYVLALTMIQYLSRATCELFLSLRCNV